MSQVGAKPLGHIIERILLEKGETSMTNYMLYKSYGVDFLRDYYLDNGGTKIKTVELEIEEGVKRAQLPEDYIDYCKIGVRVGDHVLSFLKEGNIALLHDKDSCGDEIENKKLTSEIEDNQQQPSCYFHNHVNSWGEHEGGFYGYGGGRIKNGFSFIGNSIQLSSSVTATKIYLEYIHTDMIYGEDTFVPIIAEEACKSYVKWKLKLDANSERPSSVEIARQRYVTDLKAAKRRSTKITVEDIEWAMSKGFMMSPKI